MGCNAMAGVLMMQMEIWTQTNMKGRKPREDGGRDWSDASTGQGHQGRPAATASWTRLKRSLLRTLRVIVDLSTLWSQTSGLQNGERTDVHCFRPPRLCWFVRVILGNSYSKVIQKKTKAQGLWAYQRFLGDDINTISWLPSFLLGYQHPGYQENSHTGSRWEGKHFSSGCHTGPQWTLQFLNAYEMPDLCQAHMLPCLIFSATLWGRYCSQNFTD